MDDERMDAPDRLEVRAALDESYRTCAECGGDCDPDMSIGSDGLGTRIAWVCPKHGLQTMVDPFEELR